MRKMRGRGRLLLLLLLCSAVLLHQACAGGFTVPEQGFTAGTGTGQRWQNSAANSRSMTISLRSQNFFEEIKLWAAAQWHRPAPSARSAPHKLTLEVTSVLVQADHGEPEAQLRDCVLPTELPSVAMETHTGRFEIRRLQRHISPQVNVERSPPRFCQTLADCETPYNYESNFLGSSRGVAAQCVMNHAAAGQILDKPRDWDSAKNTGESNAKKWVLDQIMRQTRLAAQNGATYCLNFSLPAGSTMRGRIGVRSDVCRDPRQQCCAYCPPNPSSPCVYSSYTETYVDSTGATRARQRSQCTGSRDFTNFLSGRNVDSMDQPTKNKLKHVCKDLDRGGTGCGISLPFVPFFDQPLSVDFHSLHEPTISTRMTVYVHFPVLPSYADRSKVKHACHYSKFEIKLQHYCMPGAFYNSSGSDKTLHECLHCPGGWSSRQSSDAHQDTSCVICGAGRFSAVGATDSCKACPSGFYSSQTATSNCSKCPIGWYQKTPGSAQCTKCAAGKSTFDATTREPAAGASACVDCNPGRFNDGLNTRCEDCAIGLYSATAKATVCERCPPGKQTRSPTQGQSECIQMTCESGEGLSPELPGSRDRHCEQCPPGSHSRYQGSRRTSAPCRACPRGFFQSRAGENNCSRCIPPDGSDAANSCPPGATRVLAPWSARWSDMPEALEARADGVSSYVTSDVESGPPMELIVMGPALVCVAVVFTLHRRCRCIMLLDMFASAHRIRDGHALRKVKTLLGGAFTVSFWIMASAITIIAQLTFSDTSTAALVPYQQHTLERLESLMRVEDAVNYGELTLELRVPLTPEQPCNGTSVRLVSCGGCERNGLQDPSVWSMDDAGWCTWRALFPAYTARAGMRMLLAVPIESQVVLWRMSGTPCRKRSRSVLFPSSVEGVLQSSVDQQILGGSETAPTIVGLQSMRSFEERQKVAYGSTTLSANGVPLLVLEPDRSPAQTSSFVRFDVTLGPLLYVVTVFPTMSFAARVSVIFSILTSLYNATSFLKKFVESYVRKYYRVVRKNVNVPPDIARTTALLQEQHMLMNASPSSLLSKQPNESKLRKRKKSASLAKRTTELELAAVSGRASQESWRSEWSVHEDESGNVFYYNPASGISSWEVPDDPSANTGGAVDKSSDHQPHDSSSEPAPWGRSSADAPPEGTASTPHNPRSDVTYVPRQIHAPLPAPASLSAATVAQKIEPVTGLVRRKDQYGFQRNKLKV